VRVTASGRGLGRRGTLPLIHRADDARGVVGPPKGGWPADPAWYQNLVASPDATIQVKGEIVPVRATTAKGAERARLWSKMTEVWPDYDAYQARTEREIPVVVLSRRE